MDIEKKMQRYNDCRKILRDVALPQVQNFLQHELNMNDPQLASMIYDFYENRYQEKISALAKSKDFALDQCDATSTAQFGTQETLERRLEQNFNVGTQILLIELLKEAAQNSNLSIELKDFLKATHFLDHLLSLYGKLTAAMAEDFAPFTEKTKTLGSQISEAIMLLEQASEQRGISSRLVMQNKIDSSTEEEDKKILNKSFR